MRSIVGGISSSSCSGRSRASSRSRRSSARAPSAWRCAYSRTYVASGAVGGVRSVASSATAAVRRDSGERGLVASASSSSGKGAASRRISAVTSP